MSEGALDCKMKRLSQALVGLLLACGVCADASGETATNMAIWL